MASIWLGIKKFQLNWNRIEFFKYKPKVTWPDFCDIILVKVIQCESSSLQCWQSLSQGIFSLFLVVKGMVKLPIHVYNVFLAWFHCYHFIMIPAIVYKDWQNFLVLVDRTNKWFLNNRVLQNQRHWITIAKTLSLVYWAILTQIFSFTGKLNLHQHAWPFNYWI